MTKGQELYAALRGVRDFLNDLGQLLVAGDMLMAAHSWEPVGDTTCLQGLSYSLYEGRRWMPRAAYRRYTNTEYLRVVAMTSVLLDEKDDYSLTEPLVCGLFFVFPEGTPPRDVSVEPWNALWPGWRGALPDGSQVVIDETDPYWKNKWGWRYMKAFACPLVEITSQDALKEKIIDPLLAEIAAYAYVPVSSAKDAVPAN
jgi:hypothetical protein